MRTTLPAYIRDDALDAGRAERVLHELRRCSGDHTAALPRNAREGALITVDNFVGRGAHWCYWSTDAAAQLPMAAVPLLAGRFPGRDGAAHPPILPGGRPAGRSVAGRPCFALCLPGGPDAPAHGPRRSGCCPPRFCTACAEPPVAEHPRRAGNGIRNARRPL